MQNHISIESLSFRYESSSEPLFQNLDLHFAPGWTAIVGKNGSGKSTLAKMILGEIFPDSGKVIGNTNVCYVSQESEISYGDLEDFIYDGSNTTGYWKNLLNVKIQNTNEFEFLSYGERRRVILARAFAKNSSILILDEPTNHLDFESVKLIQKTILQYRGVGILISHDRYLLDEVANSCVFLSKNFSSQRPGNYSAGKQEMERETNERVKNWQEAKLERKKLEAELFRRREDASLSHKHRSKKGLDLHDHDGRHKKNLARVTGKDGQAGRLKKQLDKRTEHSVHKEESLFVILPEKENIGLVWKTKPSKRNNFFHWEKRLIPFGFADLKIENPILIKSNAKIGISGTNGSGKSSLLRFLQKVILEKKIPHLYLPQEFSEIELKTMKSEFQSYSPEKRARVLAGFHRLGSDPKRFSESEDFSPGEWKKLFLSIHLESEPEIILLDEPTNHLDILSVEALESSLSVLGTPFVFVSHDRRFLLSVAEEEWILENWVLTQKHLDRI
ncbi:ATP-binding cassette domain-containing protein [Leptospira sp. 96542]|nr:ATP-binding cassette domain-containing protein [Leptospira sp. 96542]